MVGVARRPHDVPDAPLEFIDDGLTEAARIASLDAWLAELDRLPPVSVTVRASDSLAEARAEGEV